MSDERGKMVHPTLRRRSESGTFRQVPMNDLPAHVRLQTVGVMIGPPNDPVPDVPEPQVAEPTLRERAHSMVMSELTPHSIMGRVSTGLSMLPGPTHGWDGEHARHQSSIAYDEARSAFSALSSGNLSGAATMGLSAMASGARALTGVAPVAAALHATHIPFASEVADRTAQAVHAMVPDPVGPIRRPGPKLKKE